MSGSVVAGPAGATGSTGATEATGARTGTGGGPLRSVLLRADAAPELGVGHLVRALAVAEAAAARGWRVALAGRVEGALAEQLVAGAGALEVLALPARARAGGAALAELAAARGAGVLHVDSYDDLGSAGPHSAGASGLLSACRAAGVVLSSVADGPWGRRAADIVLDADWRAGTLADPGAAAHLGTPADPAAAPGPGTVLLRGPAAALLRPSVAAVRERRRALPPPPGAPVLVVMGGTDAAWLAEHLARAVADALAAAGDAREVLVVDPRGGPGHGRVRALAPSAGLLDLAAGCALVVSAAGTTTFELAAVGVPMAVVRAVDNQGPNADGLAVRGAALDLGTAAALLDDPTAAAATVAAALAEPSGLVGPAGLAGLAAVAGAAVDGRGAERLVEVWEQRLWRAVPARTEDADLLRVWRNDPRTRAASGDTAPVEAAAHAAWLARLLADPGRHLWLVRSGAVPVGVVRAEARGTGRWELSISLGADHRGRGLAPAVLATGLRALRAPAGAVLVARIRRGNAPSQALFTGAGFRLVGPGAREGEGGDADGGEAAGDDGDDLQRWERVLP